MKAIASSRNLLHASLQLLTLGVALKNVHSLRKGILKSLQFTASTCTAYTALACYTSHLTHTSCARIFPGAEEQQRVRRGEKNNQGLIFLSDKICSMSHLSVKGNNLCVNYYKDNFKFSRNISPCLHWPEPSHQAVAPCSWGITQNLFLIIYVKSFRRSKIWGPDISLNK